MALPPGAVEVTVIAKDGAYLNGPDHRSLGLIEMGDTAIINESYLPHLREHGIAVLSSELGDVDPDLAQNELEKLAAQALESDDDSERSVDAPRPHRGGRPRASSK